MQWEKVSGVDQVPGEEFCVACVITQYFPAFEYLTKNWLPRVVQIGKEQAEFIQDHNGNERLSKVL